MMAREEQVIQALAQVQHEGDRDGFVRAVSERLEDYWPLHFCSRSKLIEHYHATLVTLAENLPKGLRPGFLAYYSSTLPTTRASVEDAPAADLRVATITCYCWGCDLAATGENTLLGDWLARAENAEMFA